MITVLEYLVIAAAIAAVVFVVAVFVFGRGERMAPLPAQTSPAELPDRGITAQDVHGVKFAMALRGYRMSDVDWTLERLALRIDELTKQVVALQAETDPDGISEPAESDQDDLFDGSVSEHGPDWNMPYSAQNPGHPENLEHTENPRPTENLEHIGNLEHRGHLEPIDQPVIDERVGGHVAGSEPRGSDEPVTSPVPTGRSILGEVPPSQPVDGTLQKVEETEAPIVVSGEPGLHAAPPDPADGVGRHGEPREGQSP